MKLKILIIFIFLSFFLSLSSCDYTNEDSYEKSQENIKKVKQEEKDFFKTKPSLPSESPKNLEGKIRDLFTPDEVSPIRGFARKVQALLKEFGQEKFDIESFKKELEADNKKDKKDKAK